MHECNCGRRRAESADRPTVRRSERATSLVRALSMKAAEGFTFASKPAALSHLGYLSFPLSPVRAIFQPILQMHTRLWSFVIAGKVSLHCDAFYTLCEQMETKARTPSA